MGKGYVIKRILYTIFIFFVVITLNFFIPRIGVEDPAERYYPAQGNMTDIEYDIIKQLTREQYGFDVSTFQQYLRYLNQLMHGDLGTSLQAGSPKVIDLIAERVPWTLVLSASTMLIGVVFGILIGALCGYYGGMIDGVVMRLCDAVTAFPSILLAMVVIALTGPGTYNVIAALGILFIPSFARLVRGEFIKYRGRDFVQAAKLAGVSDFRIIFVHILPNTWSVLLSGLTIGFNNAVLSEASMSFLGIGVGPADASLGRMLSEAQGYLFSAPWCTVFPALIVVLIILGIGMLGEGIRERVG